MTTDQEHLIFSHLLRMVSVLKIIELDHERGHTGVALAGNITTARRYLMEHCPALLLLTELCYRGQVIPEGLAQQAECEALYGRNFTE